MGAGPRVKPQFVSQVSGSGVGLLGGLKLKAESEYSIAVTANTAMADVLTLIVVISVTRGLRVVFILFGMMTILIKHYVRRMGWGFHGLALVPDLRHTAHIVLSGKSELS